MTKFYYSVIETTVVDENGIQHLRYGLSATISIPDIFEQKDKAEQLAMLCNNIDLSIEHFFDIIEDALSE